VVTAVERDEIGPGDRGLEALPCANGNTSSPRRWMMRVGTPIIGRIGRTSIESQSMRRCAAASGVALSRS
jgi:hypothetical protein